jgi:hypothetical protein
VKPRVQTPVLKKKSQNRAGGVPQTPVPTRKKKKQKTKNKD